MRNILIVSHCDFPENSAVHVHHFANELVRLGLDCVVCVPCDKNKVSTVGQNFYKVTQYSEISDLKNLFENKESPDIVHAWTPREHVRLYCSELAAHYNFKQIIHLEDNEECILEKFSGQSMQELLKTGNEVFSANLSHPVRYREFLSMADGVTLIMDRLQEFVPEKIPTITLWPGVDTNQFFPRRADLALKHDLVIPSDATVLCYIGNVHLANADEVKCLYKTVAMRNINGKPTVLVRTGIDSCNFLGVDDYWMKDYSRELGYIEREKIPDILALADILVQPGQANNFNDYRFPSKIPEFLAMGKPVILPKANIGCFMENFQNALVLPIVDEYHLSDAIDVIIGSAVLREKLSTGAMEFARAHLDWAKNSISLLSFYVKLFEESDGQNSTLRALKRVQSRALETQAQLRKVHAEKFTVQSKYDASKAELIQINAQLQNAQEHLEITRKELEKLRNELAAAKERNTAMESSKFWKMRELWFSLKAKINFLGKIWGVRSSLFGDEISTRLEESVVSSEQNLEEGILPEKSPEILFISHDATRTGAPFFLLRLIPLLTRKLNLSCTILLCRGGELEQEFKKLGDTFLLSEENSIDSTVLKVLKRKNIQLVYSNTITNGAIQKHLKDLNVPILCHVHELGFSIEKFFGGKNLEYVLNTTDIFLAGSQAVYSYLSSQKNISSGRMYLAYPFVEISENHHHVASLVASPLSLPEDSIVIGACGTIGWRKGTDLFIQLAQRVSGRTNRKVVFVWLGGPASDSERQSINYDLEMSGMKDFIIFTGAVNSHLSYFTQFDVFVLPSREDPYPLVVLDAASLRIPIVCFDGAGGTPELVESDAGRSVPYLDVERMATSVLELVEDDDLRKQLGQKAYTKVLERNDIESGGNHILEIVRKYL